MYRLLSAIEQLIALAITLAFSPVLITVTAVVWILSRSAPLVAHRRVGRNGVPFWMLKFRTMWNDVPGTSGLVEKLGDSHVPNLKIGGDPRVTSRFAAFCRKHSIDELPQLLHVVTGQMSLVGPRPVTAAEWDAHYGARATEVLRLKPGLTGLWQTRGRNRLTYRQRRRLDIFLARHYCLLLYLRILGTTVPRVLAGRDAW
jgi:lipopolysaccharide/colanic/teichoic acid biosynthesis glycosyltransferase